MSHFTFRPTLTKIRVIRYVSRTSSGIVPIMFGENPYRMGALFASKMKGSENLFLSFIRARLNSDGNTHLIVECA